jgi:hypothetical protein
MHGTSKQLTEAAAVTCVKLCKASTYINNLDSNNVAFTLVQNIINELKVGNCSLFAVWKSETSYPICRMINYVQVNNSNIW